MLRQYELVERVKAYDPEADEDLLNRAYVFSVKAHGSQLRASGDPYFSHPIEVAGILTDLQLDDKTIATAILHDTIEDTVATQEQIEKLFGPDVGRLVDGVTKLSKIETQTESERQAENLRKFLLAMSNDIRVLLVKLADRLHNMRTLHHIGKEEKRRRIARETMDIYAPLAERIGMYGFMEEMQELAFKHLEPEASDMIAQRMARLRDTTGANVHRITGALESLLRSKGLAAKVTGREKRPYSIWRKMQARQMSFEQLSDVMAFRVTVEDVSECYRALGIVHGRWPMVPGRFKDFISTPKPNGYRSLHTSVLLGGEQARIEVQIRTKLMHEEAEYGLAAHWAYKQGAEGASAREAYPWLEDLLDVLQDAASPEELLENARLAMFQDQVFAFTPKGELYQLPRDATPVDFAYAVHSDLGDSCVGAKVNGRVVPLRTRLVNGDQVEILKGKVKSPDPAWEAFVASAKARAAIRRHVRQKRREELQAMGLKLLDALAARLRVTLNDEILGPALGRLKIHDRAALELAMAENRLSDDQVAEALVPGASAARRPRSAKAKAAAAISIEGLTPGVGFLLCDHCRPVPGDRIVGVRHPDGPISVHVIDCDHLADESGEWLDVRWGAETAGAAARISVVVHNQPGALASLAASIAAHNANIVGLALKHRDREFHTDIVDIEVESVAHLATILTALRQVKSVVSAERVRL
ncbi:bifunctional (p)ppGpp synthetase/guanosine-3',5'-bis(diphosphate) 3'-pyrophosphohydrolase [Sandarakinorhabdus cyanobacteriorum]|uniref:GTP pyrophosphokinase rsh n=1 Tax=Sandarakinorhabdus cyanobacteriorum TaxID=1981098 RepID=A0A255YLM4_9SPHN|nr:bifunctional (p)ppGpp synthetase/guanosine-3',5'-bis(diphosphate) 3'-pyrophosphohydrolase [Sandarakinorhabdus cyanobacteriorum]OYQ30101.1 bifunctional (p)ppGpp synthetase/guanosine-3',5'-bis(diphosphate) 3'-pyrophosphohydrolase [Sandarakinorhabdus cyanobacteriorum]